MKLWKEDDPKLPMLPIKEYENQGISLSEMAILVRNNSQIQEISSFLKNRKIPKRGVHMLRHSFGKHMVSKNINLSTIKALMGHENIQTTLIYARSDEESMIRAVV